MCVPNVKRDDMFHAVPPKIHSNVLQVRSKLCQHCCGLAFRVAIAVERSGMFHDAESTLEVVSGILEFTSMSAFVWVCLPFCGAIARKWFCMFREV